MRHAFPGVADAAVHLNGRLAHRAGGPGAVGLGGGRRGERAGTRQCVDRPGGVEGDAAGTLQGDEGVSQQVLAKRLYVTKGNISGLLDRLETAGLVERRSTQTDRRQYEIYLTPAGRIAAEKAIALQRHFITSTFGRLGGDDLSELERLLVAVRDRIREETPSTESVPA